MVGTQALVQLPLTRYLTHWGGTIPCTSTLTSFLSVPLLRYQDCDSALLRRFERRIMVPLPDSAARSDFFALALTRPEMEHAITDDDLSLLVRLTEGSLP